LASAENFSNKDRYYPTRGSTLVFEESGPTHGMLGLDEKGPFVLPRFYISLSNKEKEEDFMAMKGCKLPQRPKKRSKSVQKCLRVRVFFTVSSLFVFLSVSNCIFSGLDFVMEKELIKQSMNLQLVRKS
jgi:Protein of unknown function (DUF1639)